MYGALALGQGIEAIHNRPSRDYFDPYYQADLGDGMKFLLGASRGDHQSEIDPTQDWNQVISSLKLDIYLAPCIVYACPKNNKPIISYYEHPPHI